VQAQQEHRLYLTEELTAVLQLNQEQVDHLIRTGQLRRIRICGEERIDSREVDLLIATYKQIAERKDYSNVQ
jgi:hypothetical protein